jgi:hypothetical protein
MTKLRDLLYDPRASRAWQLAALVLTVVLAACQENDGGGGGAPGY